MRKIMLLNCPEIGMHLAFLYACVEACHAFKRMGHTVLIARSISELNDDCIVFMGNDIHVPNPAILLAQQAPRAVYIGWYWNEQDVQQLPYFVHTHENKLKPKLSLTYVGSGASSHIRVPFLLRANDDPELIGTYPKNVVRHYCYMGYKYNPEMVPSSPKYTGYYYGTKNLSEFLNYETRKRIYLSSMFALGFQSKVNADEKHVSQRIYEGLAYGCIVLSNSEAARDQTDGIVEFVSSRREIETKIDYYLNNPKEYLARQAAGYNFIKTRGGTNHATAESFIDSIRIAFPGIL
jgi:hypothetical protein